MFQTLRFKINAAIFITFLTIAIIFGSILVLFEVHRRATSIKQITGLLNDLLISNSEQLGNEIFGEHSRAIEATLKEIIKREGVLAINIYDFTGRMLATTQSKDPPDLTEQESGPIAKIPLIVEENWNNLPVLTFNSIIRAYGEEVGYWKVHYSLQEVTSQTRTSILIFSALLFTLFFLMAGLLNILMYRMVIKPIYVLKKSMERVEEGDLEERTKIHTRDVIGMLAQGFNNMVSEIQEYSNRLKFWNKKLEQKVQERTSDLSDALHSLKTTQTKLVHSEKMASLGTIVAGAAHELNNPNNFVFVGTENLRLKLKEFKKDLFNLMKEEDEEEDEIHTYFETKFISMNKDLQGVKNGSKRIDAIVKGLRTFSRLDEAEFKIINIVESLRSAMFLVQANYRDKVKFIENFSCEPELICWPAEINQAFMNLLNNGCQAILSRQNQLNGNEDLEMKTKGELKISIFKKQSFLKISFQDNGCGMIDKVREKMFEPFFTTREIGEGVGLGLAIVYGIIEQHKGKIEVETAIEKGTTMTISLPLENQS